MKKHVLPDATTGAILGVDVEFLSGLKAKLVDADPAGPPNAKVFPVSCDPDDGAAKLNGVPPAPNAGLASDWLNAEEADTDPVPINFKLPDWLAGCPVSVDAWPSNQVLSVRSRYK